MCVCPPLRLSIIISGVMWHDMDPIRLVIKQLIQLYMVAVVGIDIIGMNLELNVIIATNLIRVSYQYISCYCNCNSHKNSCMKVTR